MTCEHGESEARRSKREAKREGRENRAIRLVLGFSSEALGEITC